MLNCARLEKQNHKGAPPDPSRLARYAIYYTPQPGTALAAFGRSWFGRVNDGATLEAFSTAGLAGSGFAKMPAAPGRYTGLHALFRPPFVLRDGIELDDLKSLLIDFATHRESVDTGPLTLARSGRYLVLRPIESRPALERLSAECIRTFERVAAADDANDDVRHLSHAQRLLLKSFGNPQVTTEHRFSITLTGPLEPAHLERVSQALWPVIEEICTSGVTVDGLSLFGDGGGRAPMRLVGRYRLGR